MCHTRVTLLPVLQKTTMAQSLLLLPLRRSSDSSDAHPLVASRRDALRLCSPPSMSPRHRCSKLSRPQRHTAGPPTHLSPRLLLDRKFRARTRQSNLDFVYPNWPPFLVIIETTASFRPLPSSTSTTFKPLASASIFFRPLVLSPRLPSRSHFVKVFGINAQQAKLGKGGGDSTFSRRRATSAGLGKRSNRRCRQSSSSSRSQSSCGAPSLFSAS